MGRRKKDKPESSLATLAEKATKQAEIVASHLHVSFSRILGAVGLAGLVLLFTAALLDGLGINIPGNGLRWLYWAGSVALGIAVWSVLVDFVVTFVELRFFLRLVMLPSSHLMIKWWLNSVCDYVVFTELFNTATVNGVPPQPDNSAEKWVERLLLCWLLFMCVCVLVMVVANGVVLSLYSDNSRAKIISALQHEYVMYRLIRDRIRAEDDYMDTLYGSSSDGTHHSHHKQHHRHSSNASRHAGGGGGEGGGEAPARPWLSPFARRQQIKRHRTLLLVSKRSMEKNAAGRGAPGDEELPSAEELGLGLHAEDGGDGGKGMGMGAAKGAPSEAAGSPTKMRVGGGTAAQAAAGAFPPPRMSENGVGIVLGGGAVDGEAAEGMEVTRSGNTRAVAFAEEGGPGDGGSTGGAEEGTGRGRRLRLGMHAVLGAVFGKGLHSTQQQHPGRRPPIPGSSSTGYLDRLEAAAATAGAVAAPTPTSAAAAATPFARAAAATTAAAAVGAGETASPAGGPRRGGLKAAHRRTHSAQEGTPAQAAVAASAKSVAVAVVASSASAGLGAVAAAAQDQAGAPAAAAAGAGGPPSNATERSALGGDVASAPPSQAMAEPPVPPGAGDPAPAAAPQPPPHPQVSYGGSGTAIGLGTAGGAEAGSCTALLGDGPAGGLGPEHVMRPQGAAAAPSATGDEEAGAAGDDEDGADTDADAFVEGDSEAELPGAGAGARRGRRHGSRSRRGLGRGRSRNAVGDSSTASLLDLGVPIAGGPDDDGDDAAAVAAAAAAACEREASLAASQLTATDSQAALGGGYSSAGVSSCFGEGMGRQRRRSSASSTASLQHALSSLRESDLLHVRRTLLDALEVFAWLRERQRNPPNAVTMPNYTPYGFGAAAAAAAANGRTSNQSELISRGNTRGSSLTGAGDSVHLAGFAKQQGVNGTAAQPRPSMAGGGAAAAAAAAAAAGGRHSAVRQQLHAIRESRFREMVNPRALLDEVLGLLAKLSDSDIPALAKCFAEAVWECVAPDEDAMKPTDFLHIFPRERDRQTAWEALDTNKDGLLTFDEVTAAVTTFLQQERSMALTVQAVRRLTRSLQSSFIGIINGIFLPVVYLVILDVARFFNGGSGSTKNTLDIFTAYVVVVSLIFSEQIRNVLTGCVLILVQQAFDVGEELVIEEAPGWRVMGIVQDFNLFYLRVKKSTDGELVTLPLTRLVSSRFTNLSRSDWKIEQNYVAVDLSTPPSILTAISEAALAVIRATPGEYDAGYGFLAVFHGIEKPNKVIIRTFHRYKFNLSAAHKRIANARHGIMMAIRQTMDRYGVEYTELRMHSPMDYPMAYPLGAVAAADAAAAAAREAAADRDLPPGVGVAAPTHMTPGGPAPAHGVYGTMYQSYAVPATYGAAYGVGVGMGVGGPGVQPVGTASVPVPVPGAAAPAAPGAVAPAALYGSLPSPAAGWFAGGGSVVGGFGGAPAPR
ncbi:hypothetical protein HXX76_015716 [Chlamydomonas incerta]|uniref:EF-hand domain-containing protein n=1 Tax=Chlamydomonas incerta TaxID=51695 RepID=A0A835S8U8_CHLIN|nr:hypothetical protein HXX76_015716 [Chlamydomonas incerta]|eukprot:KAG2422888.1 hypothetical protein HXX76_015716 [Chlamydomonas incerta]